MANIFDIKTAIVEVFGKKDTIFNHLEKSKVSIDNIDNDFDYFVINDRKFPKEYFIDFEKMLWCKYFKMHPEIDTDFIPEHLIETLDFLRTKDGQEFSQLLKTPDILLLEKNIFVCKQDIICNLVNPLGDMRHEFGQLIKQNYPHSFREYKDYCKENSKHNADLMGECLILETNNKTICNLFAEMPYENNGLFVDYQSLENALLKLKEEAMMMGFSIAIPFELGTDGPRGNINLIIDIIKKVFKDYPVVLYKKPTL
jgi:hypothetical protein